ncbi:MAG TPA: nucleotide exchange factor GrpE [Bacteroidales bacterium]|nr:nucleotide exchange factor GrpE [Bacteroidales bacterium]
MDEKTKSPKNKNSKPKDGNKHQHTDEEVHRDDKKIMRTIIRKQERARLETRINELEGNLAELSDKYLRLFSEFDNYRKRTNKERIELLDTASAGLIKELLPVLDDFDRAMQLLDDADDPKVASSVEGMRLIYNKLKNLLMRSGLEPMKSIGETFDTDFHEAITNIPAPAPDLVGKVVDEIQKGYMLKGKVIRFARVVVGQ